MVVFVDVGSEPQEPRAQSAEHEQARRPARAHRRAGAAADRDDQAALSPQRRTPQRRDQSARGGDGARLPAGGERRAVHPADSRQRHRLDHRHDRRRWPRSLCRLVLRLQDRRALRRRRELRRPALLGQVRLPRQQPRHQLRRRLAARPSQLVSALGAADLARPARSADAALHLQRPAAAERRISIRSSTPSCRSSRPTR